MGTVVMYITTVPLFGVAAISVRWMHVTTHVRGAYFVITTQDTLVRFV